VPHTESLFDSRLTEILRRRRGRLQERKAICIHTYLDPKEALEAAGLLEQPMSQENVEVVLRQVDAVNRRDAEAFVATVSPGR
jgi:hypothetical protein